MAIILAFAPSARPYGAPVKEIISTGVARHVGCFRWIRDAENGKLVCRYDAESPDPEPLTLLKSA
jgi:hypothetical protein